MDMVQEKRYSTGVDISQLGHQSCDPPQMFTSGLYGCGEHAG